LKIYTLGKDTGVGGGGKGEGWVKCGGRGKEGSKRELKKGVRWG